MLTKRQLHTQALRRMLNIHGTTRVDSLSVTVAQRSSKQQDRREGGDLRHIASDAGWGGKDGRTNSTASSSMSGVRHILVAACWIKPVAVPAEVGAVVSAITVVSSLKSGERVSGKAGERAADAMPQWCEYGMGTYVHIRA